MSKFTLFIALGGALAISACARKAPEPEPMPAAAPIVMEPAASKGKY